MTLSDSLIGVLLTLAGAGVGFVGRRIFETHLINKAVLAEVERLVGVVEAHENYWKHCREKKDTGYPLIPFSHPVFTQHLDNIGLMRSRVIVKVVQFYGYLDFMNAMQATRPQYAAAGKSAEFDEIYHKTLITCVEKYGHAFAKQC